jgi:hypothetical protein
MRAIRLKMSRAAAERANYLNVDGIDVDAVLSKLVHHRRNDRSQQMAARFRVEHGAVRRAVGEEDGVLAELGRHRLLLLEQSLHPVRHPERLHHQTLRMQRKLWLRRCTKC